MLVEVPGHEGLAFLKLYDRRFSPSHRQDRGYRPWAPEIENQLLEYSRRSHDGLVDQPTEEDPSNSRQCILDEIHLSHRLKYGWIKEVQAYERLQNHWGRHLPDFYAAVALEMHPETADVGRDRSPFWI